MASKNPTSIHSVKSMKNVMMNMVRFSLGKYSAKICLTPIETKILLDGSTWSRTCWMCLKMRTNISISKLNILVKLMRILSGIACNINGSRDYQPIINIQSMDIEHTPVTKIKKTMEFTNIGPLKQKKRTISMVVLISKMNLISNWSSIEILQKVIR